MGKFNRLLLGSTKVPLFASGGKNRMNLSVSFLLLRPQEVLEGADERKRNVSVLNLLLSFLVTVIYPLCSESSLWLHRIMKLVP